MKLPFSVILDGIRDTISSSGLERSQLLTNKDLHNIEHSFNVGSEAKGHPNDGTSVETWVNEINADPDSCVLLYKPQGVTCSNFPLLKSEDFAQNQYWLLMSIRDNEASEEVDKIAPSDEQGYDEQSEMERRVADVLDSIQTHR
ncbi:hypothetical protein JTE90_025537 [Oedothorax gibbosus]|uniref:Uncharacterized protein n=1 Tax=Oedothorax gibbosus TaxID=931172 RepID=A0AAV6TXM7_9ARAC|nr:hypothetical protein JTE90_025537 [Oedothorax gibbosus]